MHRANLVAIAKVRDVPPDIRPFVSFRAEVEGRTVADDDMVAVLVIDTTTSYIPVFLKDPPTMADLEEMLRRQDATLTAEAKAALSRHIA